MVKRKYKKSKLKECKKQIKRQKSRSEKCAILFLDYCPTVVAENGENFVNFYNKIPIEEALAAHCSGSP